MLDHLLDFEPTIFEVDYLPQDLSRAPPRVVQAAQLNTADWLTSVGAPAAGQVEQQTAAATVQRAFAVLAQDPNPDAQRAELLKLKTPEAVRHLTGMLTAYDWAFVEQAQQLRGYAVSKILEETKHPDARIRLRALEMLGRVTEVALFTDRVEVKKTNVTDDELNEKIKQKLAFFAQVTDVSDVSEAKLLPTADAPT